MSPQAAPPLLCDDTATANLQAAFGLPGAEGIDVRACLRTLDQWAAYIRRETERLTYLYHRDPGAHDYSFNRFRAMAMVTVLQRDLHVHYRQELIDMPDADFFRRSEHLFIHGVIQGVGGTCASLPPVYVAMGRRLGYPLREVRTYRHSFVRWDDPSGERFNIECTSRGFVSSPDEYYQEWPKKLTPEQLKAYGGLRSLTPLQEIAQFLASRAVCLGVNDRLAEAAATCARASDMDPHNGTFREQLDYTMGLWEREQHARLMVGFPPMRVKRPPRQFPRLPERTEWELARLRARERILNDPRAEKRWWGPLRKDSSLKPPRVPGFILVEFPPGTCEIAVTFSESPPADFHRTKALPC
jgi:hypothetical protein